MKKHIVLKPQKHLGATLGPCVIRPPESYYKWEVDYREEVFVLVQVGQTIPYTRYYDFEKLLGFCHQNLIEIADVIGVDPGRLKTLSPQIADFDL